MWHPEELSAALVEKEIKAQARYHFFERQGYFSPSYRRCSSYFSTRGISDCPCATCTVSSSCTGEYQAAKQKIPVFSFGFIFGIALGATVVLGVIIVEIRYYLRRPSDDDEYTRLLD